MKKVKFKLQNIIFYYDEALNNHWWLFNRESQFIYDKEMSCYWLEPGAGTDFFTYFNSFSLAKWKKFTNAGEIYLNLRCRGKFTVNMFGHYRRGNDILREDYPGHKFELNELTDISIKVPSNSIAEIIGFGIEVDPDTPAVEVTSMDKNGDEAVVELKRFCIESGCWSTVIDEDRINPVRIAIASTTFKKESFITRNTDVLERELFYSDEPAKEHIRMNIVDNGRTLNPELYNSEYIRVFPNKNVGGSGGFTRGILESMRMAWKPTHVLLMDDDVRIMPESLIRTYTLLSLVKEEYRDRYISGAMLYMEPDQMHMQHEDVGYVHADGSYGPNKPDMPMHLWSNVFINDEIRSTEYSSDSYAGWWYCCIPTHTINVKDGLPIPVFIRGDDVEFSISNKAEFISLNGICIWHLGFTNKFTGSLELYQVHRNSLILQAMSGICKDKDFIKRIDGFFRKELARLSYQNCELLLDSIEDYCKGPDFLSDPSYGELCMKEHNAKNEKMVNASREFPHIPVEWDKIYQKEEKRLTPFEQWVYKKTYNGQRWLPKSRLKKGDVDDDGYYHPSCAAIAYDWFDDPAKQYRSEQILAVNPFNHTAFLRTRSKKKFKALLKRHKRVMRYYYKNKTRLDNAYLSAAKRLKSEDFWINYLEMDRIK